MIGAAGREVVADEFAAADQITLVVLPWSAPGHRPHYRVPWPGLVGAERHGLGVGLFELLLAGAGAQLIPAVLCADVVEARRACGRAGPYRSAGGRLVGERDDAARR